MHPTNKEPLIGFCCIPRRIVANMANSAGLADKAHIEGQAHNSSLRAPAADREELQQEIEVHAQECELAQGEYEHGTEMKAARSMGVM